MAESITHEALSPQNKKDAQDRSKNANSNNSQDSALHKFVGKNISEHGRSLLNPNHEH